MTVTKKVYSTGNVCYENELGFFHREDGPAAIYIDGEKAYYLYGKKYRYEEWLKLIPNPISVKWREYCGNY